MHLIYHSATATIVSASKGDPSLGLPGVSGTARSTQPSVSIDGHTYFSTMGEIAPSLQGSRWSGRGWTYQEGVFSRRSIFFTDDQVHFVCRGMKCREAFEMERYDDWNKTNYDISMSSTVLNRAMVFNKTRKTATTYGTGQLGSGRLWNFYAHLFNYRSRQLSYDSDAVNAFRGIISGFGFQQLWGVPIPLGEASPPAIGRRSVPEVVASSDLDTRMYDLGLAQGLWMEELIGFYCDSPWQGDIAFLRRNTEFPTWSWAGWTGRLREPRGDMPSQFNQIWLNDALPRFQIELLDGSTMSIKEYCTKADADPRLARLISKTLIVEGSVIQVSFQRHAKEFASKTGIAAFWCPCHQGLPSQHGYQDGQQRFPHLRLYEEQAANSCLDGRLFTQEWEALVLTDAMWASRDHNLWLMILDCKGGEYHVVGKLFITAQFLKGGDRGKEDKVKWKSQPKVLRLV